MAKPIKKETDKKEKQNNQKTSFWSIAPYILIPILFGLIIAFQTGLLDIDEFKQAIGLLKNNDFPGKCPITSKDTGNECWTIDKEKGIRVSGVITYEWCDCPIDTDFIQWDNITAGGPYKICTCKAI